MNAGDYIRLRREAALLTCEQAARRMADPRGFTSTRFDTLVIGLIERDELVPPIALLERLRTAFAFDVDVYVMLGFGKPAEICRDCGCSEHDACIELGQPPCAWADHRPAADGTRLCTRCSAHHQELLDVA